MENGLVSSEAFAPDTANVLAFPPLLALATAVVGLEAHVFLPDPIDIQFLPLEAIGKLLIIAAGCLIIAARGQLSRAGTGLNPNEPTTALVTSGPYRFTRNPVYVAFCLANLGTGLWERDLWPVFLTLVLGVVLHFGVVKPEERYLDRKFGESYEAYRESVHRWL
jgi:protein-S-isoprenylcysteine O-methyltransferase Ste14